MNRTLSLTMTLSSAVLVAFTFLIFTMAAAKPLQGAAGSPANAACIRAAQGVTLNIQTCNDAELKRQNILLNRTYQDVMGRLTSARQAALRTSERAWIAHRDARCRPAAQADAGGTAASYDAQSCLIAQTARRAQELSARP